MFNKIKNKRGIGLVEVVIALGISIIIVTSMVSLSIFTLRSSLSGELLFEGTKYANEYLEKMRAFRDTQLTWSGFLIAIQNCDTNDCSISTDAGFVVTTSRENISGTDPVMQRYFRVSNPTTGGAIALTDQTIRVTVTVSWNLGGVAKQTNIYTDLTNWRSR